MPKASKKKSAKEADFKKVKTKLGKGKKVPSNATDTSFKARSIALPNQNPLDRALQAPSGEPITSHGLVLDEVLLRFRHPNAGARREAIGGLKEILIQQPQREAGKVTRVIGGSISDEDGSVRKTLLGFLGWYIKALDKASLTPHLPLLLLQTSSALSHIFPEIRLDAARLVHLFLDHIPEHVTSSWPSSNSTILEGLRLTLGLGGDKAVAGASTQSGRLGAQGKVVALRTILAFVRASLEDVETVGGDEEISAMFKKVFDAEGESSGNSRGKGKGRQVDIDSDTGVVEQNEGYLSGCGDWGLEGPTDAWEIGRLETEASLAGKGAETEVVAQLYNQLHSLLLATFLEAAPTAFSPSSSSLTTTDQVSLELCSITASLTELLARFSLGDHTQPPHALFSTVRSQASDFLKRMAAWFPFTNPSLTTTITTPSGVSPLFELSLAYSKLAILLAPKPKSLEYPRGKKEVGWKARVRATEESWKAMRADVRGKGKGKGRSADGWALEEVAEWIITVLSPSPDALSPGLTPQAYTSILSLILPLLLLPPTSDLASSVGIAFLTHLKRQGSASQIRGLGDQFLIELITAHETRFTRVPFLIPPSPSSSPSSSASPSPSASSEQGIRGLIMGWLENIPKSLWELNTRNQQSTTRLLTFLLALGNRGPESFDVEYSLIPPSAFGSVGPRLGPWFYLDHPTKGGKGPWGKCDKDVQRLGLDVATIWGKGDDKLGKSVQRAVEGEKWAEEYWRSRTAASTLS